MVVKCLVHMHITTELKANWLFIINVDVVIWWDISTYMFVYSGLFKICCLFDFQHLYNLFLNIISFFKVA